VFVETPVNGSLSTTIFPGAPATSGARWRIDSGDWQNSGDTTSGLWAGTRNVTFDSVAGWSSPLSQSVTVSAGQTTFATGTYGGNQSRVINLTGDLMLGKIVVGSLPLRSLAIANKGSRLHRRGAWEKI
jgi:hypothetical protein